MDKIENLREKIDDFAIEHPVAYLTVCCVGGFAVVLPLCVLSYRYAGKVAGKAAAQELIDAGVRIGY